jgi:signal transduction histidine kinase
VAKSQLRAAALAALTIAGGVVAEASAPSTSPLLTATDFFAGCVCAVAGAWLSRKSLGRGSVIVGMGLLWFAGTAAGGWPGGPAAIVTAALLAYRVPLIAVVWQLPGATWRLAAGAAVLGTVALALPVRGAGIATASLLAIGAARSVAASRTRRVDARSELVTRSLLAVALAVIWLSTAAGAAGDGFDVGNDLLVSLIVVAVVWPVDVTRSRGVAGAVIIELGPAADAVSPVVARLRRMLADDSLLVRFQTSTGEWVDDSGRPAEPPDPANPRVTHVTTAAGGAVVLLHGSAATVRPDLSSAAAAASGLAHERVELDAESRRQAELVAASRRRLLDTADEERRLLEAELRNGPLATLAQVDDALRGVGTSVGEELRAVLLDAVDDLVQLGRGLYPAAVSSDGLEPALRRLVETTPLESVVEVTGDVAALSMADRALVWFVCSECLTNTVRHAQATRVTIRCEIADGVRIAVEDDGTGGASVGVDRGLRGLADRLDTAGGQLSVDSPPGGPTVVVASAPLLRWSAPEPS